MATHGSPSVSGNTMLERPAPAPARGSAQSERKHKLLSVFEIIAVYGIIEAALWTEGVPSRQWILLALAVVIVIGLYRRDLWPRLGLGRRGLAESLWIIPGATALSCGILSVAYLEGTIHMPFPPQVRYVAVAGYLLWAMQQQYLLQSFFLTRFESLLGGWSAVLAATLLFSFAHVPNPILMLATFAMALVFCALFRVYRNIYALAVAHAMLGLSLSAAVPETATRHMRVGIGYLHYISR
jgi:membrane protease YdiL (CAAX protease family)